MTLIMDKPTAFALGESFMSTYILPFEVVSVLLLVAMIGATYIARGKSEGDSAGAIRSRGGSSSPGERGGRPAQRAARGLGRGRPHELARPVVVSALTRADRRRAS